jgi:carbon-monoxide dehydrogenase medium subunit
MDIATLGVASVVRLQNGGTVCGEVRVALGAVASTPIRAYAAEDLLRGQPLTRELVEAAARQAQGAARPIDDLRGSAEYRRAMVGVLTKRTLERAIEAARSGPMPFELQRSLAVQMVF